MTPSAESLEAAREICLGMGDPETPYFQMGVKRVALALEQAETRGWKGAIAVITEMIEENYTLPQIRRRMSALARQRKEKT